MSEAGRRGFGFMRGPLGENFRLLREAVSLQSQFSVNVLWNVGSLAILGVSGIAFNVIVARFAGAEALGVFNQVYAVYIFLSQIAVGGMQYSVLRYVSYNQADPARCTTISLAGILAVLPPAAALSVGAYLVRNAWGGLVGSEGVAIGLGLAAPGLLFFSLNKVLLSVLNGLNHMRAFAVFQAMRYILLLVSLIVILAAGYPDPYLALSLTIAEIVLCVGLVAYASISFLPAGTSGRVREWIPKHVHFGVRGMLSGVCSELNTRVDVLMLGFFTSDALVGIYSFASILAEGFILLSYVIRNNVDPVLGARFAEGDRERLTRFARKVIRTVYLGIGGLGILTVLLYPVALRLLVADPVFRQSWPVFGILMAGIILSSGHRAFQGIFLQGGRPGMTTVLIAGLVLTNIALNGTLIPFLGIYGAAAATGFTFTLEAVLIVYLSRRLFNIRI